MTSPGRHSHPSSILHALTLAVCLSFGQVVGAATLNCEHVFNRTHQVQSALARAIMNGSAPNAYTTLTAESSTPLYVHGTSIGALQAAVSNGSFGISRVSDFKALSARYPKEASKHVVYAWEMNLSNKEGAMSYARESAKDHRKLSAFGLGFEFRDAIDIVFRPLRQNVSYKDLQQKLKSDLEKIAHLDDPMGFKVKLSKQIEILDRLLTEYSETELRDKANRVFNELRTIPQSGILVVLKASAETKVVEDPELAGKAHGLISDQPLSFSNIEAIIPLSSEDEWALSRLNIKTNDLPFRKFKSPLTGAPEVSITSFAGLESFHESRTATYRSENGRFTPTETKLHLVTHNAEAQSHLDQLQTFPLGKMKETGYLTDAQAKMFGALGGSLDTRQITFYEVSREVKSVEELEQYPTDLIASRFKTTKGKLRARTAALWSVAGQIVERGGIVPVQLPWEKEEARKGQALDRTKYKYVWEWGRASQDISGEVDALTSASVGEIYNQLVELGGRIEDAYVMMHSFDKVNTRLYALDNPGTLYPANWKDQNDSLFLVPLSHLLKKHPPSRFSARVRGLIDASEGMFSEIEALNFIAQTQHLRWREWDLKGTNPQPEPIVVTDWSHVTMLMLALRLETYPFKSQEHFDRVLHFLLQAKHTLHSPNFRQKYSRASNPEEAGEHLYRKLQAIEISNINPQVAKNDPYAVATILVSTYANIVSEIANSLQVYRSLPPVQARKAAIALLMKYNVKFGITSLDAYVLMQCHRLFPVATDVYGPSRTDNDPEIKKIAPYLYSGAQLNAFDAQQIEHLWKNNEEFFISRGYDMKPDYWSIQYHTSRSGIL